MWHVNNEFGCHNPLCYCEVSSGAFRSWLLAKYSDLQSLNQAWGTDFWSQRYHEWSEISAPKVTPMGTHPNPGMMLDFHRFSNWQILELFKSERNAIREAGAKQPITTNFMSLKHFGYLDYFQWAEEVDFVSTDHYLISQSPNSHIELAFQADLTRGFARGKPWLLMEHSTSAVNWQPVNYAKVGNQMMRNSLSHVARGSDGAMFFQWRASISGSEKFHSAMVPHAGTSSKLWKNVLQLGSRLAKLNEIKATETEPAEVAMVFDYESWWALSQPNLPSSEISYPDLAHEWYEVLWDLGIRVDFVPKDASLDQLSVYKCVLMPMTYVLSDADEEKWLRYKASGCTLVVSYLSGIVDELDRIKLGGYGGRLVREGLGAIVEEFAPLSVETNFELSNGMVGFQWQQWLASSSGETIANFSTGPAEGCAAITKTFDSVPSWYLGTRLGGEALRDFFRLVFTEVPVAKAGGKGVEVIRRGGLEFVIDHNRDTVDWRDIENVGH
jgi:beta-galactosidase